MRKRFCMIGLFVVLLAAFLSFGGGRIAYAQTTTSMHSVVIPNGCGAVSPYFKLQSGGTLSFTPCSGTYAVGAYVVGFVARGWSGYMEGRLPTGINVQFDYCDNDNWSFDSGTYIYSIYLSPTKETWC
jgi:hypothetical protein